MFQGKTLSLTEIENGFAELNFDNQSGSVNKFNIETLAELREAIKALKANAEIRGLLLTSSKAVFVVGADITEFKQMFAFPKEEFIAGARSVNDLFSEIEDLPMPTVAAINGYALGGGFEICLACDSRVIASNAAVGLPETSLGILPGWGGSVRLPRLAGLFAGIHWIATGEQQKPDMAINAGAVDLVVEPEALREQSLKMLAEMADGSRDYQQRRKQKTSPMDLSEEELKAAAENFQAAIIGKVGTHFPAPLKAVELITGAVALSREEAVKRENEAFYEITQTPQARALVGLFLNDQYIVKLAKNRSRELTEDFTPVQSPTVIGAGIMGGGIAYQNALKGLPVVMKDMNRDALDLGIKEANKLLGKRVSRGRISEEKAAAILASITPTLEDDAIAQSDMVVEAVVELESVKKQVLAAVENQVADSAFIASNTSTISITQLARDLQRPENFCGMHFFNPVHAMPLVEIIRGEKTSDHTIAAVSAYALALGKKPIVVNDCPGFLVNRVLFALLFGLEILLAEGADFQQVDKVTEAWGLPMGPAYLMDVIGIDTINHCYPVLTNGLPERFKKAEGWPTELIFNRDRLGQKNGRGYYKYELNDKGKPAKLVDPEVIALFEEQYGAAKLFDQQEILDRLMLPMAMEMVHCLEEGIVASPAEADMSLIYGVGFPVFHGGICRWMDETGLQEICDRADKYTHLGELYRPTEKLRQMAANGESFYG